jgi:hypothetical protein
MYDLDGNGVIDKEEMKQIMEAFYKLVGPLVTFSGKKYESPQQLVDEFFGIVCYLKDSYQRYNGRKWRRENINGGVQRRCPEKSGYYT